MSSQSGRILRSASGEEMQEGEVVRSVVSKLNCFFKFNERVLGARGRYCGEGGGARDGKEQ
jgi:hypothetical protein